MIQFILVLFSIVSPNNNFVNDDQNDTTQVILKSENGNGLGNGGSTTGNTGQTPPT